MKVAGGAHGAGIGAGSLKMINSFGCSSRIPSTSNRTTASSSAQSRKTHKPGSHPERVEQTQQHHYHHHRRHALLSLTATSAAALAAWQQTSPAMAIQGLTAGRIPGVTGPNADGYYTYQRPEGKSGGHGVGWSEVRRYSFSLPAGWDETPVSIADLGGTEIDLRYAGPEGNLFVVVAPVLRFRDVGVNADVRIDELGTPEQIIAGFAPEIFGGPISDEDDIFKTEIITKDGDVPYYFWEVKPHSLVAATAVGNRLFMQVITANNRQWRKSSDELRVIQKSFHVPKQ